MVKNVSNNQEKDDIMMMTIRCTNPVFFAFCYGFPIGTNPKKISVSELGVIFWGSPLFLAVFGHSHVRGATTLNFGPISTKLGGTVRAIKKMTQKDNGPGNGRNYGETGVFIKQLKKCNCSSVEERRVLSVR